MLLEKEFYTIEAFANDEGIAKATIIINASHAIFEGHFPGAPVVPGVCMVQMTKELLEKVTTKETRLTKADQVKFLSVINPAVNNVAEVELKYKMQENEIEVMATITNNIATCFKMKASFMFL